MPDSPVVIPYVPRTITVHLGAPDAGAANVTVPFADYVKNVVSSEIYPTWEPSAIRANTLAIVSYALNRIYTDHYRSRRYPFDITSSTAYDQKFIQGRNIYENISEIVDALFHSYLRRQGFVEPLAAKFCNGTTTACDGLSQWGSQYQALDGADSVEILRTYYGNDVEIVANAPIEDVRETYPGTPLRTGSTGSFVTVVQVSSPQTASSVRQRGISSSASMLPCCGCQSCAPRVSSSPLSRFSIRRRSRPEAPAAAWSGFSTCSPSCRNFCRSFRPWCRAVSMTSRPNAPSPRFRPIPVLPRPA